MTDKGNIEQIVTCVDYLAPLGKIVLCIHMCYTHD